MITALSIRMKIFLSTKKAPSTREEAKKLQAERFESIIAKTVPFVIPQHQFGIAERE